MTERQKFKVLEHFQGFELREYDPYVLAERTMTSDYQSATSDAFGSLFRYISQGNDASTKIAMTAPVIAAAPGSVDSNSWKVSFVMPAGSTLADMPHPKDSNIYLREVGSEKCVALTFRGRATLKICSQKENELRALATKEEIVLSSETRIFRFDPPFKPGFMHYNEIVIPLG